MEEMKGSNMKKNIIKNNRLSVEISEPGESYTGSRFDWTGFVTQITLDGDVTYCVPEKYEVGKGSGGIGFCNEFGIDQPIGYDETKIGKSFPKIGVGLLKKDTTAPYDFFYHYKINPAEVLVTASDDRCQFVSRLTEANGYESVLTKVISVEDNKLVMSYQLKNTGTKSIKTNEYCHNFIGINNTDLCKDYQLTVPNLKKYDLAVGDVTIKGDNITWHETPKEEFYMSLETSDKSHEYNWQLFNQKVGAGVRELSQMDYSKFAIWGYKHVVCPELFITIDLEPDESMTWNRVYEFYKK